MKSITGIEINNPNLCVKGTSFGCVCKNCQNELNTNMELIKSGGTPSHMTEENARAWRELLNN